MGRITHGVSGTPTYKIWSSMLQRCINANSDRYKYYGARGIKVCNRWLKFDNFLADMGTKPHGYSLERIDNDGNYEPGNCMWIPRRKQGENRRLPDRQMTYSKAAKKLGKVSDKEKLARQIRLLNDKLIALTVKVQMLEERLNTRESLDRATPFRAALRSPHSSAAPRPAGRL